MKRFLVVVDMQKDFVDGSLGTKEAQKAVDGVCKKILSFDGRVIVTMDTHGEDYPNTSEGKKLPVKHCIKGTQGFELDERVKAALRDREYTVVEKHTFGAVNLPEIIKGQANNEEVYIELVGLCTDICVISNALLLKASLPEAEISVDASCCAGVTPQSHAAALIAMKSCQIDVI